MYKINKNNGKAYFRLTGIDVLLLLSFCLSILLPIPAFALDYGDAPASYGSPSHLIAGSLKLGVNAPDDELAAQPNATATGDDATGIDDEDGVSAFPTIYSGVTNYSIPIANISATGSGTLHAWIDFNRDGVFTANEYDSVTVIAGALSRLMNWQGITAGSAGTTYARFRFTSTALTDTVATTAVDERATMAASNGEVEDYAITIAPTPPVAPFCAPETLVDNGNFTGAGTSVPAYSGWSYANTPFDTAIAAAYNYTSPNTFQNSTLTGGLYDAFDSSGNALTGMRSALQESDGPASAIVYKFPRALRPGVFNYAFDIGSRFNDSSYQDQYKVSLFNADTDTIVSILQQNFVDTIPTPSQENPGWVTLSGTVSVSTYGNYYLLFQIDPNLVGQNSDYMIDRVVFAGESCDTMDRADAPLSYGTPVHFLPAGLQLGAVVDNDPGTLSPLDGTGDGADDDGVSAFPNLAPGATSYSIPAANISATGTGTLHAWIDFNKDGAFTAAEYKSVAVTAGTLAGPLSWTGITTGAVGITYARFRFTTTMLTDAAGTTTVDERATMSATDGEIEDYAIIIAVPSDYSDAPASYGAPSHVITGTLKLGVNAPDSETIAIPNATATGDDATGTDDEDGVSAFPILYASGTSYLMLAANISATGTGTLHAWIDFDKNGAFTASEYKAVAVTAGVLAGSLQWSGITVGSAGTTYARFRFTSSTLTDTVATTTVDERATMVANNGEVEDYAVTIAAPLVYPAAENEAECPVAAGATFTPSYQVGWNHGGADPYAPTLQASDIAAAQSITAGSGISYLIDLSTGRILNANQTGRVDAYQAGDYAQYSFTTSASVSAGRFWKGLRYGVMSTASIHTPYKISVLASTDPTFTTATLLLDGHTVTAPASGYVQTVVPFTSSAYLLPSTTYYLRVIFHDATSSSGELRWDDLVVGFADCRDYSDAPTTSTSYGSASHAVVSGGSLRLGADIDAENTGLASANADGDDTLGLNDEASVSSFPNLSTTSRQYSLNLPVSNASGSTAYLVGWIDFNRNGLFDTNEAATVNVVNGANNKTVGLTWKNLPSTLPAGTTYLRLRLTTDPSIATGIATTSQATGLAFDGEVEDYPLTLGDGGLSLSGRVYHDANVSGSDNAEVGIGKVTVVLHDTLGSTCRSTQTDADGRYSFSGVLAGNYTVYEAAAESLPQPDTCPPVAADPNGYLSSTANTQAVTVSTTPITGIDFGDVQKPQFTLEHSQAILPGSSVTYPHRFTALVDGEVSFSLAAGASPVNLNWGVVLYVDTNCNAELDGGDTELTSAYLMNAGQSLCLLAKVLAPTEVSSGASHILEITSSFTFGDGSLIPTPLTQIRTDLTQTSAGSPTSPIDGAGKLKLSKAVWNVTRNIQGDVTLPGEILRYTLSYENIGNGVLDALVVQDSVPEFSQMVAGSQQCGVTPPELTLCSPIAGGLNLEWVFTGKLLPGSQGQVFYEVLVE